MPRKPRNSKDERLWIAPNFTRSRRPHKPPIAKPVNPDFPPLSPELDNDSSVARLLELADIALTRNTDDDLS
ncbi:MAG TPA: hypothetical protein VHN74_10620 [Candidatus Angelobacter sp.]|jgi:hypothetical protein|nr:hypothetical protein [Candidatus Angelobacter sp.]